MDWIIHYILNQPGSFPYLANTHTHGMEHYHHLNFQEGDLVSGLYEDCDIRLKKVMETGRDVLRLVIPDKYNRSPAEPYCMEAYKYQELPMFEE